MKKILFVNSILVLLLCLITFISFGEPKGTPFASGKEIEESLKTIMDSIIADTQVPGLVTGIWAPNEGVSFVYTTGISDLKTNAPMDVNMIFRIGSNTKTFTVTVLLQLVDEGLINLNDQLSDYLPDFPRSKEVNIEMLTNMRSGIYNYSESEDFGLIMLKNPTHFWLPEDLIAIAAE